MFATLSSVYRFVIPFISFVVSSIQHQHEPLDMSECASTDKTWALRIYLFWPAGLSKQGKCWCLANHHHVPLPISSLLAYKHSQHKWNMGSFSHLKGEMVSRHSLSYSIKKPAYLSQRGGQWEQTWCFNLLLPGLGYSSEPGLRRLLHYITLLTVSRLKLTGRQKPLPGNSLKRAW